MSKYPGNIVTTGADAGYSVYFPGSGSSYVVMTNASAAINPTTSTTPFTIECWVYTNGTTTTTLYAALASENYGFTLGFGGSVGTYDSNQTPWFGNYTGAWNGIRSTTPVAFRTWTHIACVFTGSTCYIYQNGVMTASGGPSTWGVTGSSKVRIGCRPDATTDVFNGYIAGARVVIGSNLYPGGTTFTPPTVPLNITNTQLLVCNSPNIVDQSTNAFPLTVTGTTTASTFTPFTGYQAYNPALGAATPGIWTVSDALQAASTRQWNMYDPYFNYTTLKLGGNGTNGAQNNSFLDSSSNNFLITRNGNTTQGSFTPFTQTGWSNYFNGSSSYISSTIAAPGTGDFTYEFWVYAVEHVALAGEWGMFQTSTTSGGLSTSYTTGVMLARLSAGGVFSLNVAGTAYNSSVVVQLNTFYHIAIVRNSGTISMYVNGVNSITSGTNTTNITATNVAIGGYYSTSYVMKGYISNFRATNAALYTSSFTPPTSPLTSSNANTTLLTCQSNRFLDTNTQAAAKTVTPSGTPSVQAFSPFKTNVAYTPALQGGSGYFDGTGDFLNFTGSSATNFNGTDWTVETWVYLNGAPTDYLNIIQSTTGANNWIPYLSVGFRSTYELNIGLNAANNQSTQKVVPYAWNHIAVVRSGGVVKVYLNGAATSISVTVDIINSNLSFWIGKGDNTPGGGSAYAFLNGYICGIRFTKTAVYTAAFTPPTAPPTAVTNTSLLLNFTNAGITDATAKNVLETAVNAQISTTKSKFGGSSMYFDQSSWLTFLGGPNLAFGTGDYTVEAWVNFSVITASDLQVIFMSGAGGNNFYLSAKRTDLNVGTGTTFISTQLTTFSANTWYHVAACRSGTTLRLFVNGTQIGSSVTDSTNWISSGLGRVGSNEFGTQPAFGYIQDLRITKGYARYITNFTPPTSLLQNQ